MPKQLLALTGPNTMIQETVARARGAAFAAPIVIAGQEHRFMIAEQLRAAGIDGCHDHSGARRAQHRACRRRGGAEGSGGRSGRIDPADAVRSCRRQRQGVPCRGPGGGRRRAHRRAGDLRHQAGRAGNRLWLYQERRADLDGAPGAFAVERFVEKPDRATAETYLASGDYYWNSGMFLFSAKAFIKEMERLEPVMLGCCRDAITHAHRDMDFIRLGEAAFLACPSQSIDYAIMEHVPPCRRGAGGNGLERCRLLAVAMGYLAAQRRRQHHPGRCRHREGANSYIRSEGPLVAVVGVENLVVVATKDAVLVSHRDAAQDVKKIVAQLESQSRGHHMHHTVVHRPWGSYESIDTGDRFQVKRIIVKPGAKLSLQMHHHRAEHWIVVSGAALVTCDDKEFLLQENKSTYIPLGSRHRLENPGKVPLHLIEVQSGAYLGEDDIVRFEDTYGRAPLSKKPV